MRTQSAGGRPTEIPTLIDLIKKGYFQQVRFLVEFGTTLDERDENRRTPLMLCAFVEPEKWGVGMARMFIENGARLDLRDKFGLNAFHLACIYERIELTKVFLNAIDFNLTQGDKHGNTALHYAVRGGNTTLIKLLVQHLVRYGMPLDKPNFDGYAPIDEAYRLSKKKIIKILESPVRFCDQENIEANLPLELSDFENEANASVFSTSRRSFGRPRSSVASGRSSRLSSASTYQSWRRSPTIYNYDTRRYRKYEAEREIPFNEKNNKMLIRCASISDFRNNPEYLFHAIPLEDITDMQADNGRPGSVKRIRPKTAYVRRQDEEDDCKEPVFSWRTEFKRLFTHFQYQCSPSYRETIIGYGDTALPHLDKPGTPSPSEAETDDDKRKGRKGALSRQNTKEVIAKGKPPPAPKPSSRRMSSQSVGHGRQMSSVDGSLGSSSESVNSTVSSKKQALEEKSSAGAKGGKEKHGKGAEETGTGRQSRIGNYKGLPTPTVNISVEHGSNTTTSQSSSPASTDSNKLRVIDER